MTDYNNDFDAFVSVVCDAAKIRFANDPKAVLTSLAVRLIVGGPIDDEPVLHEGWRGFSLRNLGTTHFHFTNSYWCELPRGERLCVTAKSVHGNELVPKDIAQLGMAVEPRFSLGHSVNSIQFELTHSQNLAKPESLGVRDVALLPDLLQLVRKDLADGLSVTLSEEYKKRWTSQL